MLNASFPLAASSGLDDINDLPISCDVAGFDGYAVDGKDKQSQDCQEEERRCLRIGGWGLVE
jgi:hypothetical protein